MLFKLINSSCPLANCVEGLAHLRSDLKYRTYAATPYMVLMVRYASLTHPTFRVAALVLNTNNKTTFAFFAGLYTQLASAQLTLITKP
jgi:hypothetical protein